jgi:hypothetical protein
MKKLLIVLAVFASCATLFADEVAGAKKKSPEAGRARRAAPEAFRGMRQGGDIAAPRWAGPWVASLLSSEDSLKKIGVEDAAVSQKIKIGLKDIKKNSAEIEKKIRALSRKQAEMMKALMSGKVKDSSKVFAKIDELAALRSEQGKLAVKTILLLRENLTDAQMKNARRLIMQSGRSRIAERRRTFAGRENGRRRGSEDGTQMRAKDADSGDKECQAEKPNKKNKKSKKAKKAKVADQN